MIPIRRGDEPAELTEARAKHLKKARKAFDEFGAGSEQLKATLKGYDSAKGPLYKAQHRKCAYCERKPGFHNQPVEHFRPKAEAWRHMPEQAPSIIDEERYWWLTWEWSNLLFACATCNGRAAKSSYFPLAEESAALRCPTPRSRGPLPRDTKGESPLLLDPADPNIDLFQHIEWITPDPLHLPFLLWTWRPYGRTLEGRVTVEILKLEELEDDVSAHYAQYVSRGFRSVREQIIQAKHDKARAQWRELVRLARADQPFAAAAWWQLEALRAYATRRLDVTLESVPRPTPLGLSR